MKHGKVIDAYKKKILSVSQTDMYGGGFEFNAGEFGLRLAFGFEAMTVDETYG